MKRSISFITMLALLLAMIMPTAVSADPIPLTDGNSVELSYQAKVDGVVTTDVHPGDAVTVSVMAKMVEEAKGFKGISLGIQLPDAIYDIVEVGTSYAENTETTGKRMSYIIAPSSNDVPTITIDTTPTEVFSFSFTVPDSAAGTYVFATGGYTEASSFADLDNNYSSIGDGTITFKPMTLTIKANEINVTVNDAPIENGKIYYEPNGVTVAVDGTNITEITVQKKDGEPEDITSAKEKALTAGGEYTVTVKTNGRTETYTFTLVVEEISAQFDNAITVSATGYKRGESITIPVTITGLGTVAKASMLSYGIEYDKNVFEVEESIKIMSLNGDKYVYGDEAETDDTKALPNETKVAEFTFTVKGTAAYGNATIKFTNPGIALYKASAPSKEEVAAQTVGFTNPSYTVTIVPEEGKALAAAPTLPTEWSKTKQTIELSPETGVSLAWKAGSLGENPSQEDLAAAFEAAESGNTVTANAESAYYVIAKIGGEPAVYQVVAAWSVEDVKIDTTVPTVEKSDSSELPIKWVNSATTISKADFTVTDELSGDSGDLFIKADDANEWTKIDADGFAALEGNHTYTIKAVDNAGNEGTATVTVKVDTALPVITAKADTAFNNENGKNITVEASDALSGLLTTDNKETVTVYFDGTAAADATTPSIEDIKELADPSTIELEDGSAVYNATKQGMYYFVVSDNAGNQKAASVYVTIETLQTASDLKVKTYMKDNTFHLGFLADDALAVVDRAGEKIPYNGMFTKVALTTEPRMEGCVDTLNVKKDGASYDYTDKAVITESGTYTVTVTTTYHGQSKTSEPYTFVIAAAAEIPTPSGASYYNIADYARIRRVLMQEREIAVYGDKFYGGTFSGDLNGNLKLDEYDLQYVIDAIRSAADPGEYTMIPIMNQD